MPMEIEAKFRVADPDAARRALADAGAQPAGSVLEHNTYFDTPDARLRREDRGLRIRVNEPPDGPGETIVTYKGPRRPGDLKIRPETELAVAGADAAAELLTALGFRPGVSFQKRRERFGLGGARIVLDELPEMGFFLEIEADDEQAVRRARTRLGLDDQPVVTEPYVALVAAHLSAAGREELRF